MQKFKYKNLSKLLIFFSLPVYCADGAPAGENQFDDYVNNGARILMVGAHPDDESIAGPLLVHACVQQGNSCRIALFTRGGGGACGLFFKGCKPDLATVRRREMQTAAERYGAALDIGDFFNAPVKMIRENPGLAAIRAAWEEQGDPVAWLQAIIERFQPDVLITLDPDHGFTGNVEHRLASVLVTEALRRNGNAPTRSKPPAVFYVLNRYQSLKPLLGNDPAVPSEEWSLKHRCGSTTCVRMAMKIAGEHRSQLTVSALALFVLFADKFDALYLKKLSVRVGYQD